MRNNHKTRRLLLASGLLVTAGSLVAAFSVNSFAKSGIMKTAAGECNHVGYHYDAKAATASEHGYKEFWTCCKCHEAFEEKPTGSFTDSATFAEMTLAELEESHPELIKHYLPTDKIGGCEVDGCSHVVSEADVDLTTNDYGAKFMCGANNVGGWGGTSQATKLVIGEHSLSVEGYGFDTLSVYMPRIDFTKIEAVSFDFASIQAGGATYGNKHMKFNGSTLEVTNGETLYGRFTIGTNAAHAEGEVWASLTINRYSTPYEVKITDEDVINGSASFEFAWAANVNSGGYSVIQFSNMTTSYRYGSDASRLTNLGFAIAGKSANNWGHMSQQCLYYAASDAGDADTTLTPAFISSSYNRVKSVETWINFGDNEMHIGFEGKTQYISTEKIETVRIIVSPNGSEYDVEIKVYQLGKSSWDSDIVASDFEGKTPVFSDAATVSSLSNSVKLMIRIYRALGVKLGTVTLA